MATPLFFVSPPSNDDLALMRSRLEQTFNELDALPLCSRQGKIRLKRFEIMHKPNT